MNEKAITLTVFFTTIFLFYQIRFIIRFRKLKKIRGYVTENGFFLEAYNLGCCDPCIEYSLECACCTCVECSERCFGESYKRMKEKRDDKQSDEVERKSTERRIREQEDSLAEIEQEKKERIGRVEALRASGYTATDEDRHKVIEIVSVNPKTGLSWTSNVARLPVEEIIMIIENEQDFEVRDEYIINKKKVHEKEEKIKIAKITCPNCENLFELGSDFCPNCGDTLET